MHNLAQTAWPRFGCDRANSSLLNIVGPHSAPSWKRIVLPSSGADPNSARKTTGGVIVMPDNTLRVLSGGVLSVVAFEGTILWQIDLRKRVSKDSHWIASLPTALESGEALLLLPREMLLIDGAGKVRVQHYRVISDATVSTNRVFPEDSGYSPNLTYNGQTVVTPSGGEVYLLEGNGWREMGVYGYDVLTPAIYPDNSLASAGYARQGFCWVAPDGTIIWRTALHEADLLPTLNRDEVAAIGSLNEKRSAFFRPDGQQLGEYPHAATFAVYPDGGWIALSKERLARLTLEGKELWSRAIEHADTYTWVEQPVVDKDGFIFVREQEGYQCLDAQGKVVFEVRLARPTEGLASIVASGVIAYVQEGELVLGYE
jgi:hypothetical protein